MTPAKGMAMANKTFTAHTIVTQDCQNMFKVQATAYYQSFIAYVFMIQATKVKNLIDIYFIISLCKEIKAYTSSAQCYNTFYVCNLRMIVISQSVCPMQDFQPILMFVGKAIVYLRANSLSGAPLGWALALLENIKTDSKSLPGTNALVY